MRMSMGEPKRLTTLALLALACLMGVPSVAQARYASGMNLYEYVRGAPTASVDPMGLTPWTNRRTTISVQAIVGANQDDIYGPETCAKVRAYQDLLRREGLLPKNTPTGKDSVDGKWGDQTEDAYRTRRCGQLGQCMNLATEASKSNIGTIEKMHGEQDWWRNYYTAVQWANAIMTTVTGVGTGVKAAKALSLGLRSEAVLKNAGQAWLTQADEAATRLALAAKQQAKEAAMSAVQDALSMSLSTIELLEANAARRKKMAQYEPYIKQAMTNIEDLSRGWSSAFKEWTELDCKKYLADR